MLQSVSEPVRRGRGEGDKVGAQTWDLPVDQAFLEEFLTYVFTAYWDRLVFGPILEGAVFELKCPAAPTICQTYDGYLKVSFGGPHFHLCIGESEGSPEELRKLRRPATARLWRRLNENGHPTWWGFETLNGLGDPTLRIFFDSPFLENADFLPKTPRWHALAMWRDITKRYLGLEPDPFDEAGSGPVGPPAVQ